MTPNEAVDAAVLAYVQSPEDANVRDRIASAVAAYEAALGTCRACRGSGRLRARGALVHLSDGYRPANNPVPDGDEIVCVACGGHGMDLDELTWHCSASGYPCTAERHGDDSHANCGWARRVTAQPAETG